MTELLENGWVVVVKHDCPTCELVQPVLRKMADSGTPLQVFSQDDPSFPEGLATVVDDRTVMYESRKQLKMNVSLSRKIHIIALPQETFLNAR